MTAHHRTIRLCLIAPLALAAGCYRTTVLPSGNFANTYANKARGADIVGYGGPNYHALLWQGLNSPPTDLHPSQFDESAAFAADGSTQVGQAWLDDGRFFFHAMVWNGSAQSAQDIT